MSHTLPDYTTKYKLAKIFGNVDNAELAARLGACSTMDRRGNLIWYDDFEAAAAVKWDVAGDAGYTMAYSTDRAWMGNQSMKTVTHTDAADNVILEKSFCLPLERRIGIEFMFNMTTGKPEISILILGYTGAFCFNAIVQYNHNTGKLYYLNSAGAYVELTRHDSTTITNESWFFMKLVIDWDVKEYVRFIFCGTEYDLTGIPIRTWASILERHVDIFLYNTAVTAAASTVYFDNFILTQNEP